MANKVPVRRSPDGYVAQQIATNAGTPRWVLTFLDRFGSFQMRFCTDDEVADWPEMTEVT